MNHKAKYDIIVVGAGPAGSMAAYTAAKAGASVLLLEKDRDIGTPVRCAEAIGQDVAEEFFGDRFDPSWKVADISRFRFTAPDGTEIHPQVKIRGYVLNRKVFDAALAGQAAEAGAEILTRANVVGLVRTGNRISGVRCLTGSDEREIGARVIIGADGVESRVGRWAGVSTAIQMRDMETCFQVTLGNVSIEQDMCAFYFSQEDFPGGYAWVFPKGDGCANVGLGISGNKIQSRSPEERLRMFLSKYFPGKPVLGVSIGGVPCADRPARISTDGLLLAGDAACQTNPISGGGIAGAMVGGSLAGVVAADAVNRGDVSARFLASYERQWDARVGKNQHLFYKLKLAIQKLSDPDLNDTAHVLAKLPERQQTLARIFQTALRKKPSLMLEVAKLFNPFS